MDVTAINDVASGFARSLSASRRSGNPFTRVLADAQQKQAGAGAASEEALAALKQRQDQALGELQTTLTGLFQAAGVDTSQEIQLQLGADGKLSLANDHPGHAQIDQVLAQHPELAAKFQALANSQRQLDQNGQEASSSSELLKARFSVTLVDGQATARLG